MAIAYNKVILVGRITYISEMRSLPSGKNVINFGIAVDRGFNDQTDFFNIVTFDKKASFVENYLEKGKLILVEGSLRYNKYTDREGVQKEKVEISASNINFMETKKSQQNQYNDYNDSIKVEDSYEDDSKENNFNNIKEINDDIMSKDMPDFDDPFSDLDDDLNNDDKPI